MNDIAENLPVEDEDRQGVARGARVFSRQEIEFARQSLCIRFAKCLLDARLYAHRRGLTDDMIAGRIGWSVKRFRKACLGANLKLDEISDVIFACGCEITIEAIGADATRYTPYGAVEPTE